ncbi:MAG TPA: zf-TFIIB domain-containing protein [Bacteroidia bacterium]|nr:zf-TFIIB domain-containing protein [Bacteroidia bacterium]HRF16491.1 zf-TFIIB domain-containing protein [Bacteroidia bacterium]
MKCPNCTTTDLVMSERQGVEIDYCPTCRGVWLDRGELDKIIDKAVSNDSSQQHYQKPQHYNDHKYKKKHWLHDLFD